MSKDKQPMPETVFSRMEEFLEEDVYRYNDFFNLGIDTHYRHKITRENMEHFLGTPKEIKEFENYTILIYDTIQLEKSWL